MDTFEVEIGPPESKRWYILVIFSVASAMQSNIWFTFSSCPDQVEDYYHLPKPKSGQVNGTIAILLNWGPIMFVTMYIIILHNSSLYIHYVPYFTGS